MGFVFKRVRLTLPSQTVQWGSQVIQLPSATQGEVGL